MSLVLRLHCPACGAPIKGEELSDIVVCEFCDSRLIVKGRRVSEQPEDKIPVDDSPGPPPSSLVAEDAGRFEVSLLEQFAEGMVEDGFTTLALPQGRFGLVFLRLAGQDGKTLRADYSQLCGRLKSSLEDHEDPGLAAYELLEQVSSEVADFVLEILILLFQPRTSSVLVYNAGSARSAYWVSGEEGRVIDVFTAYPALERKMLKMSRDHFSNSKPVYLTGSDLVVAVSAAFAGRGSGAYCDGTGALVKTLNNHLGEHPLKVVTLAKNAFWTDRSPAAYQHPLSGTLRVAAVRVKPSLTERVWDYESLRCLSADSFEVVCHAASGDHLELVSLHDHRQVVIWFCGEDFTEQEFHLGRRAIVDLLDRRDYGDNENPRRAGREAAEAIGHTGRFLILLLLNEWGRTKWYRHGWSQPLGLGPRGLADAPSFQQFDEGGEATVDQGARQFFAGSLPFFKKPVKVDDLAHCWYGGKASSLYAALFSHWRTPDHRKVLAKTLQAAESDVASGPLDGCCLVGRRPPH